MKKFIVVIMGLIITAGIVCGFGFVSRRGGKWFQESDMSKWHIKNENPDNTDNSEEQTGVVAYTSDGEALEAGGSYAMPVAYTYLGARSEEQNEDNTEYFSPTIELTANIDNPYINPVYEWTVSFANPSSEWAKDKIASSYIAVLPFGDNMQSALITYHNNFAEQIIIKVSISGQADANYTTCTVNCVKKAQLDVTECIDNYDFNGNPFNFGTKVDYGAGTVIGDFKLNSFTVELSYTLKEEIQKFLTFAVEFKAYTAPEAVETYCSDGIFYVRCYLVYSDFIVGYEEYDTAHKDAIKYAWYHGYEADRKSDYWGGNLNTNISVNYEKYGYTIKKNMKKESTAGYITGSENGAGIVPNVTLNKTDISTGGQV